MRVGQKHSETTRILMAKQKQELVASGWRPTSSPMTNERRANISESLRRHFATHAVWNKGLSYHLSQEQADKKRAMLAQHREEWRKHHPGDKFLDTRYGYISVCLPSHPSANGHGYIYEHRVVAEAAVGRQLTRTELVHHINGEKTDNRNSNLLVCDRAYHKWIHNRMAELYQRLKFKKEA